MFTLHNMKVCHPFWTPDQAQDSPLISPPYVRPLRVFSELATRKVTEPDFAQIWAKRAKMDFFNIFSKLSHYFWL